ncbi:3-oxoacyl-[acyl-carrier-protein] synthase 3 [bacterium HR39]|nr:3-oxoacyl-[acyl-carrier-protein] synthase 3 [bacterium HR39]
MRPRLRARVAGVGGHLPARVLTNAELPAHLDTSDAWIVERTGIRQRHLAAEGELTSDLAVAAARRALEMADARPEDVGLVLLATSTPDNTFPATATRVRERLGIPPGPAFDLQAVCAGFVYALSVADSLLRTGTAKSALVIGAETFSRILDWNDRSTCVLFGDGAGALYLVAEEQTGTVLDRGVLATHLSADGRHYHQLYVDGGPSSTGTVGHLRMNGREVFRHAVAAMSASAEEVCRRVGIPPSEVDWFVPHQANLRIIDALARRLGIPDERVARTVDRHANTSAASIPLALDVLVHEDRLRPGHLVLLSGIGGGFAWGSVLLRW